MRADVFRVHDGEDLDVAGVDRAAELFAHVYGLLPRGVEAVRVLIASARAGPCSLVATFQGLEFGLQLLDACEQQLIAMGTTQEHMFVGDGTTTRIDVHSIREVKCEFWHYDGPMVVGTKLTKKI